MNRSNELNSVSDVIDAFGGPTKMAGIFGGGPSQFCNFRARGVFPPSWHMRIYCECMKRGLNIAPELVGMTPDVMACARGEKQRLLPLAAE